MLPLSDKNQANVIEVFNSTSICLDDLLNIDKKSLYGQDIPNHTLQANPKHRKEELHYIYSNKTSKRQ